MSSTFSYYSYYIVDDRPSLRDLHSHVVPGAAVKWRGLGIQLLDPASGNELDIIEKQNHYDVKECCVRMFQNWLDKTPDASWNHVLEALRCPSVELNHLANQIEQKFKEKCEIHVSLFVLCIYCHTDTHHTQTHTTHTHVRTHTTHTRACAYTHTHMHTCILTDTIINY